MDGYNNKTMTLPAGTTGSTVPCWPRLLTDSTPYQHLVQLYQADEPSLIDNVAGYVREGLARGERALIIAGSEHIAAFTRRLEGLGVELKGTVRTTVFLDAGETLARFMVDGRPDAELFEKTIWDAIVQLRGEGEHGHIRAYGEMVGILWQAGEIAPAIQLEELWNRVVGSGGITLFCGYPIDIFDPHFEMAGVDAILCAHSHVVPTGHNGALDNSMNRALQEVFGSKLDGLRFLMKANFRPAWAAVPNAEAIILWLRRNLPDSATEVLALARRYYSEAADRPAVTQ